MTDEHAIEVGGSTPRPVRGYVVDAVMRACDLLDAFRSQGECLTLRELVQRTGMNKATAFRLLFTLERRGLVERCGRGEYRSRFRPLKRGRYKLGFAALDSASIFSQEVTASLRRAAADEEIDILVLDNRYSVKAALRNIEVLIKERVNLVIEFQNREEVALVIASKLHDAGIPLVALGTPHPGATYYGIDNYKAGFVGGNYLAKWAKQNWGGKVDEIILMDVSAAGPLLRSRVSGILDGIQEGLPSSRMARTTHLDGNGVFARSLEAVRKHLRTMRSERVLVGAINDPSALGALRAFEEAGRAENCGVISQDGSFVGRTELRRPSTRLVGSMAFFPEQYGRDIIRLAIDILNHNMVPPAVFAKHRLLTRENVDRFYPNDIILSMAKLETLLLRSPGAHSNKDGELPDSVALSADLANDGQPETEN
ncbi:MAG: substrate-binding domain-containing protein [Bryobacteraceae bacterium]